MNKKIQKFDKAYPGLFEESNAIVTSIENGADIDYKVRVQALMKDVKLYYEKVKNNVSSNQRKLLKESVKDYSKYYNLKESEIDFTFTDMNKVQHEKGKSL